MSTVITIITSLLPPTFWFNSNYLFYLIWPQLFSHVMQFYFWFESQNLDLSQHMRSGNPAWIWVSYRHLISVIMEYFKILKTSTDLRRTLLFFEVKKGRKYPLKYQTLLRFGEISVFSTWSELRKFGRLGLGSKINSRTKDSGCSCNLRI